MFSPVTPAGLLLNVGDVSGCVAFIGYRQNPDGTKGQAELNQLVRNNQDMIIAVNGRSAVGKTFPEVISMLKESPTFAYIRFVEKDLGEVDMCRMTSCGPLGRFLHDQMKRTLKEDRRRLLAKRSLALIKAEEEKDNKSTSSEDASDVLDDDSVSDDSASGLVPDSEDEALLREKQPESGNDSDNSTSNHSTSNSQGKSRGTPNGDTSGGKNDDARSEVDGGVKKETKSPSEAKTVAELIEAPVQTVLCKQESTWHLAYGLLGMDVGYSSDEGGDEDVAYYVSIKNLTRVFLV